MKKIISLLISFSLVFTPTLAIAETENDIVEQNCKILDETEFFAIGDERGNSVLTRKEIKRDCNITFEVQGPCIKWEEKDTEYDLKPSDYNTYKTTNYNGALGSVMASIGAYDQLGHLWSGWKGYCEIGTKYDFSWAKDPMFWASLVMSTVMDASAEGGFLEGSEIAGGMTDVADSVGNAWVAIGEKAGVELSKNFGKCLVAGGVDLAGDVYSYFKSDDVIPCDPVDEFCEGDSNNEVSEDSIITLDIEQYNDLMSDPENAKYIEVIKEEDGIVTIRMKPPNMVEDFSEKTEKEMQEAKDEIKKRQFMISAAITAGKMALCGLTGSGGGSYGTSATDDDGRFSLKNGIGMAISSLPADWLGPYGALIKAALTVILEFINSFKDIDTCHNKKDAEEAGTRHFKTYETLPYDLCVYTSKSCAQKEFFGSDCGLDAYHYCCYDQMLTKILVAQIKAQLGRDWAHCTGITLRDLNFVSFRQCTTDDKKAGFDGTKIVLEYNEDNDLVKPEGWSDAKWLESFQHKRKCIDLTEFKEHLEATFSQDIDFSDFDMIFQDMNSQIEPIPE